MQMTMMKARPQRWSAFCLWWMLILHVSGISLGQIETTENTPISDANAEIDAVDSTNAPTTTTIPTTAAPVPVCNITTLTPGSRAKTSITVTWSVNEGVPGDCSDIQLCVSPPPSQGSPCQTGTGTGDTTTFNDLAPGTGHTVNLTVTASNSNSASQTVDQKTLPSAPIITDVSRGATPQTVLTVTWSNPGGAFDTFNLQCSGDSTDHPFDDVTSPEHCTGLTAGTLYTATVTTVSGSDEAPSDPFEWYTGLNSPSISSVGPTTTNTIPVVWMEPGGGYDKTVLECTGGGQNYTEVVDHATTTGTCDSLTPGAVYSVTVRSRIVSTDPPAPPDSAIDSSSQITVPKAPTSFVFTDRTADSLDLSISKPGDPCGQFDTYQIEYSGAGGGTPETKNVTGSCTAQEPTTARIDGLVAGTTYTVSVSTCSSGVCSTATADKHNTTFLNAPTDPVLGEVTETRITVKWTDPGDNYDSVVLTCQGDNGPFSASVNQGVTTATCMGLTSGALYSLTLCTHITGDLVPPMCATPPIPDVITVPSAPTIGSVSQDTTSISFTITPGPGQCSEYNISYGLQDTALTGTISKTCTPGSPTNAVLNNLNANAEYTIQVVTVSATDGVLTPKESTPATTDDWTAPEAAPIPTAVDQGSRWVQIQVNEVVTRSGNIAEYQLIVDGDDVPQCYKVANTGTPSMDCTCADSGLPDTNPVNVTGLTPYKNYTFSVRAVNPGACSVESGEQVVLTDQDIPGKISGLTVSETADLEVSWTAPDEPNGVITSYTVRWCEEHPVEDPADKCMSDCCRNVTTSETEHVIGGLNAFFCYDVSVAASTIVGMGDFVDEPGKCTGVGKPFAAQITSVVAVSAFAVNVTWTLDPDAYPTGDFINYNATATAPGSFEPYSSALVEGFNTTSALIPGLEPYVMYSVVVIALTNGSQGVQLETPSAARDVRTLEFYPEAVDTFEVHNGQPDSCHTFSFDWSAPSKPNGEITGYVIKYQQTADPSDNGMKEFDSQSNSGSIECLNSNNAEYTFTIQAENSIGLGNDSRKDAVKSGTCHPTSASDNAIGNSHVGKSQTSVTVEVNKCDICYNSNGDVTFAGLLVIEQTDPVPGENSYADQAALDAEYGPWDNKGPGPGYRTTPDSWLDEIDCSEVISQCRGEQPGCPTARKRRAAAGTFEYKVGQPPAGGCQPDTYCNQNLNDGKKFMLRLVVGTAGGILAAPSTNTFETDKNMAWVAGVVIPILLLLAAAIAVLVIMYKRRIGIFKEKASKTRAASFGSVNPAFAAIDEPMIERNIALSMDSLASTNMFTEHRPKPANIDNFPRYVAEHQRDSDLLFADEYKLIQELSPKHPTDASEHPSNRLKNRFTNILPFDHSRVKLLPADDDDCSDYINANYMPGYNSKREFIASQGPMKSTLEDFWRMIWEQNVAMIIMVTQLEERGRERCAKYWPNDNEPMYYGDLQVQMRSESVLDAYVIRILDVRLGEIERTLKQMHFIRWPDFGVPEKPEQVLDFVCDVRMHTPHTNQGPILVHCSAGVGRTGTYIAVDRLLQHIKENDTIDVFGIVMEMRNYRCYMIQVEAQFILIHKCVLKALERNLHRQRPYNQPQPDEAIYANQGQYEQDENIYENAQVAEQGV